LRAYDFMSCGRGVARSVMLVRLHLVTLALVLVSSWRVIVGASDNIDIMLQSKGQAISKTKKFSIEVFVFVAHDGDHFTSAHNRAPINRARDTAHRQNLDRRAVHQRSAYDTPLMMEASTATSDICRTL
jgi:hypothetical protein